MKTFLTTKDGNFVGYIVDDGVMFTVTFPNDTAPSDIAEALREFLFTKMLEKHNLKE